MTLLTTVFSFQEVDLSHNQMTKMKDLSAFCCLTKLNLGCILLYLQKCINLFWT